MQFLYHKYVLGTTSLIIHISPILKFSCGNFNKHLNSYGNINDDSALSSSAYRREQLSGCWHWVAANILLVAPFFFVFFCVYFFGGFFSNQNVCWEKKFLDQICLRSAHAGLREVPVHRHVRLKQAIMSKKLLIFLWHWASAESFTELQHHWAWQDVFLDKEK